MTTTPDSRIRSDFGLPPGVPTRAQAGHLVDQMTPQLRTEMEAYWARAEPIDTSTTAGKIAVMQAHERGERIECTVKSMFEKVWGAAATPTWDWNKMDYRVAEAVAEPSALCIAREQCASLVMTVSVRELLCSLVREIDASYSITIAAGPYGADAAASFMRKLAPGRYRLLRDDA